MSSILGKEHNQEFYIASCVFTVKYPELSQKIQKYFGEKLQISIVRCCVPNYSFQYFKGKMPESYGEKWEAMPDSGDFRPRDTVYSLCHNCSAIIEESKPLVNIVSLWELILADEKFVFPDYGKWQVIVQDCWRAKDRKKEQDAVRQLLKKMNFEVHEMEENREKTDFCGVSLYRPSPERNLNLAPNRYVKNAKGKFIPHTKEEQIALMQEYCKQFGNENIVTYCHYCTEGLELGGVNAFHIASLLFEPKKNGGKLHV